jgi:pimeloyl-ACP methyl ester carboxylesterase
MMAGTLTLPLLALALALGSGSALITPPEGGQPPARAQPCVSPEQAGTAPVGDGGIRIAYESSGPCGAETVLLIGGTGQQLIEWPPELVQALQRRGYRVVRFDNRDVGRSTHLTGAAALDLGAITAALEQGTPAPIPYTLRDMAGDALGLLDALGIERAHLVGISMGGNIAQLVAIDHPQRVRSLTSIGADSANRTLPLVADPEAFAAVPPPPAPGDKAAFIEYQIASFRARAGPAYPPPEPALRQHVERTVERAYDPAGLERQQVVTLVGRYERDSHRRANLGRITAPTAIVQGADDPLQPLASAQDLAATIPGAELYVIPGLGHDLPPLLAPVIAAAIERTATRAGSEPPGGSALRRSGAVPGRPAVHSGAGGLAEPAAERRS